MNHELTLALACIRALAQMAQDAMNSIMVDSVWASTERTEDQVRNLLRQAEQALATITDALEGPLDPSDYTFRDIAGEPPVGHPAREIGPILEAP